MHDIVAVFSSNVFALVANLLFVVLITRLLGPEAFGNYNAILVIPLIVVSFFQMGIRATTVFMIGSGKYDINHVVSAVVSALLLTSAAGIVFSSVAYMLMFRESYTILLITLALMTIPLRLSAIYAGGVFLGKEQIEKANLMNWLTALLMLFFGILLVWLLKLQIVGALLSLMLSNLIVSIIALRMLFKAYPIKISFYNKLIANMLKLGVVYAISFLVIQLNYRVDILLLQWLSGARETGLYSLGVGVAELLWQIPLAVGIVVMSRSANSTDRQRINQNTSKLLRVSLVLGLVLSMLVFLLAPYIIPMVFGSKFTDSVAVMQTILPGIFMIIVFRILNGQLAGMGKPRVAIIAFIPALIINLFLNYLWIPPYGAMGAAWATNVSYALGTFIYILLYSKITGAGMKEIFSYSVSDFLFMRDLVQKIKLKLRG